MKKITISICIASFILLLLSTSTYSQTEFKLDSIQRFDWNTNTSAFKMNNRDHFTYDNGGTKETFYIWYLLTGTEWNPAIRYNKTYNENNDAIEKVIEVYDAILNVWNASTKEFYTYDTSQNLVLFEDATSSDGGVTWDIPRSETEYVYNSDNLVTEKTRRFYNTTTMTMVNLDQTTTTYDGLNIAEVTTRQWISSSNIWLNTRKIEYIYDGDLPIQKNFFNWLGSNWDTQPYLKGLITYDGNLPIEEIDQIWNSSGSVWENNFRTTRVYDTNNNLQEFRTYTWDDNSATWLNLKQELWYWSEADEVLGVHSEEIYNISIHPNPAKRFFTISNLKEVSHILVYSPAGKRVLEISIDPQTYPYPQILTHELPSGIYIVNISTSNFSVSKKLIVD